MPEKVAIMKKEKIYSKVWNRISTRGMMSDKKISFESLCKESDIDRVVADNSFYEILGMSGEEVIRHIRNEGVNVLR